MDHPWVAAQDIVQYCMVLKMLCLTLMPRARLCARPQGCTVHGRCGSHAQRHNCGDVATSRRYPSGTTCQEGTPRQMHNCMLTVLMQRSSQHRALACAVPAITVSAHV